MIILLKNHNNLGFGLSLKKHSKTRVCSFQEVKMTRFVINFDLISNRFDQRNRIVLNTIIKGNFNLFVIPCKLSLWALKMG